MVRTLRGLFLRHWKVLGLVLIASLTSVSGAYAYWRLNAQPSSTPYSTAVSPPLELRLELDKTEFQLGETVVMRLFLKNIGDQTLTIDLAHRDRPPAWGRFIVKHANDTRFFNWPEMDFPMADRFSIDPGEQVNRTFEWDQLGYGFDSNGRIIELRKPASPGTYKIIGRTEDGVSGRGIAVIEVQRTIKMETPPIVITIV